MGLLMGMYIPFAMIMRTHLIAVAMAVDDAQLCFRD